MYWGGEETNISRLRRCAYVYGGFPPWCWISPIFANPTIRASTERACNWAIGRTPGGVNDRSADSLREWVGEVAISFTDGRLVCCLIYRPIELAICKSTDLSPELLIGWVAGWF